MALFRRLDYNQERTNETQGNLPSAAYRAELESSYLELSH